MQQEERHQPSFRDQLYLLMWKGLLLHWRNKKMIFMEVILPWIGTFLLVFFRWLTPPDTIGRPTVFPARNLSTEAVGTIIRTNQNQSFVLYAPNTTLVVSLITEINDQNRENYNGAIFLGFTSESRLLKYYQEDENRSELIPLTLVFDVDDSVTAWPAKVTYKIRPNAGKGIWHTKHIFEVGQELQPREVLSDMYYDQGFLYLQKSVDLAIIKTWQPNLSVSTSDWFVKRIPFPPHIEDLVNGLIKQVFPFIAMISFLMSATVMTKSIVYDKETQIKEAMKLMGMKEEVLWMSWFLQFFCSLLITSIGITFFFCVTLRGDRPVLPNSDASLIFVFFLCYSMSVIGFAFFISTLVDTASAGSLVAGLGFFAVYFPHMLWDDKEIVFMTLDKKMALSLLFNFAMAMGCKVIGFHESTGNGAKWSNIASPSTYGDSLAFHHVLIMLVLDAAILFFLAWYIDKVRPGEYGVPQPWYFPCQPSYWSGGHKQSSEILEEEKDANYDSVRFEREPSGLPVGIKMLHLKKVFPNEKVAVKDSTLSMFEGQITVLLGHNGAGKTTTMSMLTGFITPTSGTAYVNGYNIRTDMVRVRRSLGLCPQHNILFPNLTVEEHLTFFCLLKGCNKTEVRSLVYAMAEDVGLPNKLQADANTLSGGQKRKLCVGIALIGGSKVVILDEPTSGMDPAARRQTWETLQRNRAGRTILLTTHFMDEADILGDRIAIMAEGVVQCCGTPLFLKKLYGAGYHLVIVKDRGCNVHAVTAAIQKIIKTVELEGAAGAELSYLLPVDESSKLPELFRMIESDSKALGISSFGVTATTMEEVFLKVGASELPEKEDTGANIEENRFSGTSQNVESDINNGQSVDEPQDLSKQMGSLSLESQRRKSSKYETFTTLSSSYERLTFPKLQLSKIYGMFVKNAINTLRNWKITFVQIVIPVLFAILPLLKMEAFIDLIKTVEPPLQLDLSMFRETITGYSTGFPTSSATTKVGNAYKTLFSGPNSIREVDTARFKNMDDYFLSLSTEIGLSNFAQTVMIGAEFNVSSDQVSGSKVTVTAWYSGQPLHSQPVALAYVMNAYARAVTGDNNHAITTINEPLPEPEVDAEIAGFVEEMMKGFFLIFSMLFGLAFLTASFSYFPIRERETGAKHLQIVSGVDPLSFWLSTFSWNFITVLITILLILAVFAGFKEKTFTEDNNLAIVFLVFICYAVAVLPYVYFLQFFFSVPSSGLVALVILTFITGLLTLIMSLILRSPGMMKNPDLIENAMRIMFPHFCVSNSLLGFSFLKFVKAMCGPVDQDTCQELKEEGLKNGCCPGVGANLVCMLSQALLFFLIVLAVDYNLPQKLIYMFKGVTENSSENYFHTTGDEDSDVQEEKNRVMSGGAAGDTLVLENVFKQFSSFVAVDHVFLGVPMQECFGLLGQNGAGKSTTFKILTGDVMVSSGNAFVLQHSIKTDLKQVQANMGYCPQFDALIEQMTGRETLYMYARLRGVPGDVIPILVSSLLSALMLSNHADHQCGNYSGGNKRKLSTAIALIGNPAIILLDEPTSGVDPAARRQLWTVLSKVRASGHTIILTSHSMEECEALCTRLAIMVTGRYECLGSVQHLKNKFSQGFTVKVKMATMADGTHASISPLVDFILDKFPGTETTEDQEGYVSFQLTDPNILLSHLFVVMEQCKEEFNVEDFSVYQTSLEEIFLKFTRVQPQPRRAYLNPCFDCFCPASC